MSGYVLAMAVTWGFCYSLRSGAHVRIDMLLPRMSPRIRAIADWLALMGMAFLAYVITWKMWEKVISDYQKGVVTIDYPLTPVFIPKIVIALGFTLLVITALQMMLSMLAEKWLPILHKAMGGDDIDMNGEHPACIVQQCPVAIVPLSSPSGRPESCCSSFWCLEQPHFHTHTWRMERPDLGPSRCIRFDGGLLYGGDVRRRSLGVPVSHHHVLLL